MNSKIRIFLFCPIPENQKPISEFLLLQENRGLNWMTFSKKKYQKIVGTSIIFFFFLLNIFLRSFDFLSSLLFSFVFPLFFFLLFIRWSQLEKRFSSSRLIYEEGSWYDGQIWEKPFGLLKNDRLIASQKMEPILIRLSETLLILFSLAGSSLFLFMKTFSFFEKV